MAQAGFGSRNKAEAREERRPRIDFPECPTCVSCKARIYRVAGDAFLAERVSVCAGGARAGELQPVAREGPVALGAGHRGNGNRRGHRTSDEKTCIL